MRTQPISRKPASSVPLADANCLAGDSVGNAVYITGLKVGLLYQVATVDIDDENKMAAWGIIISKSSATECVVQYGGLLLGLYAGLTPGLPVSITTAGDLSTAVVPLPLSGLRHIQFMGLAVSDTDVSLFIQEPYIVRP